MTTLKAIAQMMWYGLVNECQFIGAVLFGTNADIAMAPRSVWDFHEFMPPAVSLAKSPDLIWARQTRIMRMDLNDTREHEVIHVSDGTVKVHIPPRVSLRRPVSLVRRVSLVRVTPRLVRDELGAWDPSTVDWSVPSIYQEVSMDRMAAWGRLVPDTDRYTIAADIADRVMCGV